MYLLNKIDINRVMIIIIIVIAFPIYAYSNDESSRVLFITVDSLFSELNENNNIVMVDVRSEKEFGEFNIPDSINIPLYSVKVKSFLKNKKLVLINNGFNLGNLKEAGEELLNKGFSVRILYGGLLAWRNAGGKLAGNPQSFKKLDLVGAEDLFSEINEDENNLLVINLISSSDKEGHIKIPNIINVPVRENKDILIMFNDFLKKRRPSQYKNFLIANTNGDQYENIAHVLSKYKDKNIFYLEGGIESYLAFLNQRDLLKNRGKVSSVKQDECSSCSR